MLAISSVAVGIASFFFGGNLMKNIVVGIVTAFILVLIWIGIFIYYKVNESVVIYNNQVLELNKLNEKLNPPVEIMITLSEDGEFEYKDENMYKVARMKIFNNTETEITKCYMTLQSAEDVFVDTRGEIGKIILIPSLGNFHKPDRIRWNETKYMNEQCEIEIPKKDARYIDLADTFGTFHYNLCNGDVEANWMSGSVLHTFKIRIDYSSGTNSKFINFDGYIYAANHQEKREAFIKNGRIKEQFEIQKDQIPYLKMIFKQGDWMDNMKVKDYLKINS